MNFWPEPEMPCRIKKSARLNFLLNIPMTEKKTPPRQPILTRKEQTLLAFILALLVMGGIVRKLRTDWSATSPVPVHKS
jgi:hypothetical protein